MLKSLFFLVKTLAIAVRHIITIVHAGSIVISKCNVRITVPYDYQGPHLGPYHYPWNQHPKATILSQAIMAAKVTEYQTMYSYQFRRCKFLSKLTDFVCLIYTQTTMLLDNMMDHRTEWLYIILLTRVMRTHLIW